MKYSTPLLLGVCVCVCVCLCATKMWKVTLLYSWIINSFHKKMAPKNNDAQPELTDAQLKVISSFKKFTKCLDEVNFGEEKSSKYTYK